VGGRGGCAPLRGVINRPEVRVIKVACQWRQGGSGLAFLSMFLCEDQAAEFSVRCTASRRFYYIRDLFSAPRLAHLILPWLPAAGLSSLSHALLAMTLCDIHWLVTQG
jgi:hypothetical protein